MDREILFRGKRKDNSKWVEGYFYNPIIGESNVPCIIPDGQFVKMLLDNKIYQIIPETVGQCTGLTDKNGKKIFEGDIVEDISICAIGKVIYWEREGRFAFDEICDGIQFYTGEMWENVEILGNIYDNPELWEV